MLSLREAARAKGFFAEWLRLKPEELPLLHGPVIGMVKLRKDNHYLVIVETREKSPLLIDPPYDPYFASLPDFKKCWRGKTLVISRGPINIIAITKRYGRQKMRVAIFSLAAGASGAIALSCAFFLLVHLWKRRANREPSER